MKQILAAIIILLGFKSFSQDIKSDIAFQKEKKSIIKRLDTILPYSFHVIETDNGFLVYYYDDNIQFAEDKANYNLDSNSFIPTYTHNKDSLIRTLPKNLLPEPNEGMVLNDLYELDPEGTMQKNLGHRVKAIKSFIKDDDMDYYLIQVDFAKKWSAKKMDSIVNKNDSLFNDLMKRYNETKDQRRKLRQPIKPDYKHISFDYTRYVKIPYKSSTLDYSIFITDNNYSTDKLNYYKGIPMFVSFEDTGEAIIQIVALTLGIVDYK